MEMELLGNRYELIEIIGSGGMAHVYKALDKTLDRIVAVKILKEEFLEDEDFVKRFHAEAQAVAKLSNNNIVQVFDVGYSEDKHYIVMEFIEGTTLANYIKGKKRLSWEEGIHIAIQICKALSHAHKNNIIHRDIKPHNIIIDTTGLIKVADFGIAKAASAKTHTLSGKTVGSVHYFSPEQARGGFVDNRSDIYSLGIVMYEMLTGELPFDGETPIVIALKHLQQMPVAPIKVNGSIPLGINNIILKAIAKSVDDRYQNICEMLSELNIVAETGELPKGIELPLDFTGIDDIIVEDITKSTKDFDPVTSVKEKREEFNIPLKGSKSYKKQKKHPLSTLLAVLTAVALIILFSFYGIKELLTAVVPVPEEYEVKDYTGYFYDEISEKLRSEFNILSEKFEVFNDSIPPGIIMDQDIKEGIVFKEFANNRIRFTVSMGPELVEILPLTGFQFRIAERDLINMNLVPTIIEQHDEFVAKGSVIRTDPVAGMKLKAGEEVKVYVSLGPLLDEVEIPNLVGMTFTEALRKVEESKLKIGTVQPKNVSNQTAVVLRQYPQPGETHYEGTELHLVLRDTVTYQYIFNPSDADKNSWTGPVTIRVETIISDTKEPYAYNIYNKRKEDFPLVIDISIPYGEYVDVQIFVNFVVKEKFRRYYTDVAGQVQSTTDDSENQNDNINTSDIINAGE